MGTLGNFGNFYMYDVSIERGDLLELVTGGHSVIICKSVECNQVSLPDWFCEVWHQDPPPTFIYLMKIMVLNVVQRNHVYPFNILSIMFHLLLSSTSFQLFKFK